MAGYGEGERSVTGGHPAEAPEVAPAQHTRWEPLPAAVPLAPGAVVPGLGGEVALAPVAAPAPGEAPANGEVGESVRSGLVQAGPLAVAGLLANGANAALTILLARLLSNQGYGSLAQLTGLFLVVSLPGSAVVVGVVRRVAAWHAVGSGSLVGPWAARLHARGAAAVVAFGLVLLVVHGWVGDQLGGNDGFGAVAMLVAGAVWVLLSFDRGLIQARRDYRVLAANLLLEGAARVVGVLCLVAAGLGVAGVALGILVAEVATAVHARVAARRAWGGGAGWQRWRRAAADRSAPEAPAGTAERRGVALDLATALPAMMLVALLQNVDVIVLARDAPHRSGAYAAISVASKALVFGALVLGGYLLPEAAIRWHRGGHALRQLAVTLVLLAVPAALLLVVAVALPGHVLSVVFSGRYTGASHAFAPLVLAMIFLSVTVTLTMYLLAIGWRWIGVILLVGAGAAVAAVGAAHGAAVATARNDLVVQAGLAVAAAVAMGMAHRERVARNATG